MKRKVLLIVLALILVLSLTLVACQQECDHNYVEGICTKCGEKNPNYNPQHGPGPSTGGLSKDVPASASEPTLMLHYQRNKESDYLTWGFWIWPAGGEGSLYNLNYQDDFGGIALYPLSQFGATAADTIGIIPRLQSGWTKDCDVDRMLDLSACTLDENNYIHIYLTEGDENLYKNMDDIKLFVKARFITQERLIFETKMAIQSITVYAGDEVFATVNGEGKTNVGYTLPAGTAIDLSKTFVAEFTFAETTEKTRVDVDIKALFGTQMFNDAFYYDGELGALYTNDQTVFRVWSPVSTKIVVNIYNSGHESEQPTSTEMVKCEKGVFEATVSGDLGGKYYTYTVYNASYPSGMEIVDPYAKSAGLNGVRGQIVNFANTNPENWDSVSAIQYDRKELVVWETHVADVTSSATWTGTEANRKKFLGVVETGTTYTKDGITVATGFDHIKELGVNAVQLVPVFDQANNESAMTFNWGYNPLNYNVLEGGYSSDPTDGYVRIREFKQLVQAFNGANINVIMDVVYNHVNAAIGSNFDVLMPGYYFRYDTKGSMTNGSGCGNETASDHAMFRKFMIDSVCFWAKEYKLGGFRFDLMGLHDIETMNLLTEALKEINPNIVVYGEPWTGGTSPLAQNTSAVQSNGGKFVGYGQFNDQMRDALIKGGMNAATSKGWVTDVTKVNSADVTKITNGLKGITSNSIKDPNKTLNYATCHDNYTLYDRMVAAGIKDEATIKQMAMLANSVVLTSNGTTFILAGEEFLRTKGGDHNSYQSSYAVNELNYALKVDHLDMFANYQKLIALKKSCTGLHLNEDEIEGRYTVTTLADGAAIQIVIKDGDRTYTVIHANGTVKNLTVDLSGNTLYLDTLGATTELTATTAINPYQTLVVYVEVA